MSIDTPKDAELTADECWTLLRSSSVGRLAVWVDDHPDIFPLNYVVDHGSVVFRSGAGTKVAAALTQAPVAMEADDYDADSHEAWSVVLKGNAEGIHEIDELMDTLYLPIFPWQSGPKELFIRITPAQLTGRRFVVSDRAKWQRTP
ncbi:pyridoxamine 5'-phosphate oxidase family protein [Prescottella equi]|uniref:pyridoxamine 5'-phosphate oxidase family protein n=1 Tax=Rhodococcus hoagii TaxID=43767 RepID=UPI0007CD7809|nr:pyridoxamine 5'-phosphate oxidase family protein [Prescottella equi]